MYFIIFYRLVLRYSCLFFKRKIMCCRVISIHVSVLLKFQWCFRLCLFWVKITFGNAFSKMRLFSWSEKFYFPEIEIHWPKKKSLWPRKCFYTSIFPSKHFRKMRERERERACAHERRRSSLRSRAPAPVRDRDRRRDRAKARSRSSRDHTVDRDLAVDRDLTFARSRSRCRSRSRRGHRTGNIFIVDDFFFLGCGLCFLICVFLLLFQTPENIFRKIFWNATKHMETFSFSGN